MKQLLIIIISFVCVCAYSQEQNKCYPIFTYKGISRQITVADADNQIDTLLSKFLTENLSLNFYDDCFFRLRVKLFINKKGRAKIIKTYSDTPKILVRHINSLFETVKFLPAIKRNKYCSFTANVILLLDFTGQQVHL